MLPFSIGYTELIVVAVVAIMLFGGRLPEVAKTLGASYAQFRQGLDELKSSFNTDVDAASSRTNLPDYSTADEEFEPDAPVFDAPPEDEKVSSDS